MFKTVLYELRAHAPFTLMGTLTGMIILWISLTGQLSRSTFETLFWVLHPAHVFLSALVTTAMYRCHSQGKIITTLAIGYFGSIGIGTLSDCIIPYIGEILLEMPNRGLHLGFIEKWWLVNPLAFAGIAFGYWRQGTKFPHAGHVLLSTWASLFHMIMALGTDVGFFTVLMMSLFLFLAVWLPCCTSDIVFPLLFATREKK
ncbi:MAG: hypothetical protein M0P04_03700 [Syntrophales bacterium]|jgi:hypothetical protein|nr:hypothetical protein [Syntrophales bacterium]HOG07378.1 hypothetical protein [Syntrophales bacterium]HOS76848.1 hypothetical protein [Syntrophales bacterium]